MKNKTENEMTEVQPTTEELIAEQNKTIAARDELISQLQQAQAAMAMQAQAAIQAQEQARAHILECYAAMSGAAPMWNEIHTLAGKHADDPRLVLGLLCLSVVDGDNFKNHWRSYVEAWQLGMDPAAPDVAAVAKFAELDAAHNERAANKERERQANRSRR